MPAADSCQAADQLAGLGFAMRSTEQLIARVLGVAIDRLCPADEELADCGQRGELDSGRVKSELPDRARALAG